MCEFCLEFRWSPRAGSRIIWRDESWVTLPTLGCFVPGYVLLLPVEHYLSFGSLPPEDRSAAAEVAERLRITIAAEYGPVIIAEHGATQCDVGSQCCDHAHLHLIPVPEPGQVERDYTEVGGEPIRLDSLAELGALAGQPYVYLSPRAGVHLAWLGGGFPSQFVRRVCASAHGLADRFDWRRYRYEDTMEVTRSTFATRFRGGWNEIAESATPLAA